MSDLAKWYFILEPNKMGHILCFDTIIGSIASSISPICHKLYVIHFDPIILQAIQQNLERQNLKNVTYIQAQRDKFTLPFSDEYFDGFVFNGLNQEAYIPQTIFAALSKQSALHLFFLETYRVLKKDGFVYFTLQNKYGYNRLTKIFLKGNFFSRNYKLTNDTNDQFSLELLKRATKKAGFSSINSYKLLTDDGNIREIILEKKYRSIKNSFLLKERIKQFILNSSFSSYLAPALAFLCFKGQYSSNYLDKLILDLIKSGVLSNQHENSFAVKRYLILPGKVILSVGKIKRQYGEKIVIIPCKSSALSRLRHEAETLMALHKMNLNIQLLIPKFFLESEFYGQAYLVQQEMPGTSIDAPVSSLDQLTQRALDVLINFHRETAKDAVISDDLFHTLFSSPLHQVVTKLGPVAALPVACIEQHLRTKLLGNQIKTVWTHGDFKIENLMIDPKNLQVTGVIDWDLSQKQGLPFLDLLYLIVYNRVIRNEGSVEEIVLHCILPRKFTKFEEQLCEKYLLALDLRKEVIPTLIVMFWIYHIAYRIQTRYWNNDELQRAFHLIDEIAKVLKTKLA